ncbi:hypothetical protein Tco_1307780 [Tanacetum coccineum]
MASMGSSPFWNTGTNRPESGWENSSYWLTEGCMMENKHYGELMIDNHWMIDMVKLVVEIECFGKSFDEFDKETGSSDGL